MCLQKSNLSYNITPSYLILSETQIRSSPTLSVGITLLNLGYCGHNSDALPNIKMEAPIRQISAYICKISVQPVVEGAGPRLRKGRKQVIGVSQQQTSIRRTGHVTDEDVENDQSKKITLRYACRDRYSFRHPITNSYTKRTSF